jgi:tryptophan synthase alpha chain
VKRLEQAFASLRESKRAGFIPFIVAGDPDLDTTVELLRVLSDAGATAIELGVPFSDPAADGPVIQRAGQRALNRGVTLADIFAMLAKNGEAISAPIVLFGYYNPSFSSGCGSLPMRRNAAGSRACS